MILYKHMKLLVKDLHNLSQDVLIKIYCEFYHCIVYIANEEF